MEIKEPGETTPVSKDNSEDSDEKELQEENGSERGSTFFSYDRLKAKSDNPVTGIDLKKREVCLALIVH